MQSRLVLVTGGCRSGKSSFAQRLVEENAVSGKIYLATCPVLDAEMAERVRRHRDERRGKGWETAEEEVNLAAAVAAVGAGTAVLIDCLTLWVNNLMYHGERAGRPPGEDDASRLAAELAAACRRRGGLTVAVTNEVGWGIVPDNPESRRFRDLAGRVNQAFAAAADEVHLLVCGLPTRIK